MKIQLKRIKDCKVQLAVEVDAQTAENRFLEVMRSFQRGARLPGFREGKAPMDLIEKRFAEEARDETVKSLIPELYHQSVHSEKLSPVSVPKISDVRYQRGQKLSFQAEFEESPKISLKNYKGITLRRASAELTPEDLDKAMRSVAESRATYEPVSEERSVREGDTITADIEIWQDGVYAPGRTGVLLLVEPRGEDDFFGQVVGASLRDVKVISRQGKPYARITIAGLREKKVPALDDAFAKDIGKENLEQLKEAVRKEIAAQKHAESMEKMKDELFRKLLASMNFPLPESLVAKQKERLLEQAQRRHLQIGGTQQDWEAERAGLEQDFETRAKDQVKLFFILQRVAEEEEIEPDEIELTQRLQGLVQQTGRPMEEVRQVFEQDLRDSLREKKTVDYLIANAKFEEERTHS